jgi:uncharacterized protein (UPF0335 family)
LRQNRSPASLETAVFVNSAKLPFCGSGYACCPHRVLVPAGLEGYRPGPAAGAASPPARGIMPDVGGIAGAQLKSFIERIERLEEEKQALGEDIKEVYAEAKGTGFEPKIMRQILKIRKMDKDEHDEQESLLDIYKRALGMLPDADTTAQAAE